MADMKRAWEYGLVFAMAVAVGLVVAALVAFAMDGGATAVATGDDGLLATVLPAMAGLVATVLTLDVGLRRLNRPRAKAGW